VFVDTTNMKQFVVQAGVKHDNSGRLVFAAYDANGDMIPWDWDVLQSEADSTLSGYGGTVVRTGADVLQNTHVSVSDAVKKVRVMISGGSRPLFIKSCSIVAADDSGAPQVTSGLDKSSVSRLCSGDPSSGIIGKYVQGEL